MKRVSTLCKIEAILNSKPITKASADPDDLEALNPNHLLFLKGQPSLPPGDFKRDDLYAVHRWKQVWYMTNLFWKKMDKEVPATVP